MSIGIVGKKIKMARIFRENGECIPVTLIEAGPCRVVSVKDAEKGKVVQLGYGSVKENSLSKPVQEYFKKQGVEASMMLKEFKVSDTGELKKGDMLDVSIFKEGEFVTVNGKSKGKGFTGVVKQFNFKGGPKTHGQSDTWRRPGSIGQSADPSRVWKGLKMARRMGGKGVTVQNIEVIGVKKESNILLLKGAIPGARNNCVIIQKIKE